MLGEEVLLALGLFVPYWLEIGPSGFLMCNMETLKITGESWSFLELEVMIYAGGMVDRNTVKKAVKGVDVVYHLALNWDGATWKHQNPIPDLFDVNIRGTFNLLEEARLEGVKHFLFASSGAVYGNGDLEVVDEESPCKPELFSGEPGPAYGILKFATERLCLLYYHVYGLPVTALRIGYVFEPPSKGEIHVEDVVQAFLLATLNRKAYGQVFNVACEPTVSTRKIRENLGWKPKFTSRTYKVHPLEI